ncbi:MAG: sugar ABC transporter permease [Paracoccaceae bacterium]|jgi:alpha-glucoside transport system permease protein|nr:sugar ABC transporter permease [Paracoccaceae bacterium]
MNPALLGLITIATGVVGCVGYFYLSNLILDTFIFPARDIGESEARTRRTIMIVIAIAVSLPLAFLIMQNFLSGSVLTLSGLFYSLVCLVVIWAAFWCARKIGPTEPSTSGQNINRANMIRPWLFIFPAFFALSLYLAYPVFETLRLSLTDRLPGNRYEFVGLDNYIQMFNEPKFWESMRNNMLWLIVVPAASTGFGLLVAQLTDRIKWGNIAKSLVFMPMAISFVGASVIWKLVYDARPEGTEQIGVLNALYIWFGGVEPQTWLTIPFWNNFFLMIVLIWIQTGFAMVILSAALRGIPEETVEAAIVDGANPFQIFFKIKVPQIKTTILVVWTTITIAVLKVFDIVFAMTNGQWETQVLANYMFDKLFRANDWGMGSASAMIIMLLVTPILVWNVRNARKEMQ